MKLLLCATLASVISFGQLAISGTAMDSATGKPLAGAEVTLRETVGAKPKTYTTTTSAIGKFAISPVVPNEYLVSVKLAGYVLISASGCNSFFCDLRANAALQLRLAQEGAISGRVVDAQNKPVQQATVSLSSAGLFAGAQPTNEQGEFRIGGLAPGPYRIRATPLTDYKTAPADSSETHLVSGSLQGAVEVRAGADTGNVTIALKPHPVVRVAGTVTGSRDALIKVTQGTQEIATGVRAEDGKFEIWRLSPGNYVFTALAGLASGPVPVTVGDANVDAVELLITSAQMVKGKVVWDSPPEGVAGKPLTLSIADTLSFPAFTRRVRVEEDGVFQAMMAPERHLIRVEPYLGIPRSTYVKAIRVGTQTLDSVLDTIRPLRGELTIVLSAKGAEVSGMVRDAKGAGAANASVVLEGPAREGAQRFRQTITDTKGTYLFEGVAPGSYKLTAVESKDYWEFVDIGSLGAYEQTAEKLEIREGDKINRNLKKR